MKNIVTLTLRGRAFQIEEEGDRRLRQYLDAVEAGLREQRRGEALDEVERALSEKLAACIDATKPVVTEREVDTILRQMAPTGTAADQGAPVSPPPKRKLFRIREGQMIAGLCLGLAVYAQLDPAMVRSLFVIFGVFSGGVLVVLYLIAMFIVPVADTTEQAVAGGTAHRW